MRGRFCLLYISLVLSDLIHLGRCRVSSETFFFFFFFPRAAQSRAVFHGLLVDFSIGRARFSIIDQTPSRCHVSFFFFFCEGHGQDSFPLEPAVSSTHPPPALLLSFFSGGRSGACFHNPSSHPTHVALPLGRRTTVLPPARPPADIHHSACLLIA